MTAKQELTCLLDFVSEHEARNILEYLKQGFALKQRTWDDVPEVEPDEWDTQMLAGIEVSGDEEYISLEEVQKSFMERFSEMSKTTTADN
jgi:hypothetical protein